MPADRFLHPRAGRSHKVTMLTDLEYRVWTQYLLSADDFGVMHATAVALQNGNLHLANRPVKVVKRCLDALVKCGLLRAFDHQGQPYVCQHDWQDWQKVTWPTKTINPCPPAELLAMFSPWTQLLFTVHPGARKAPKKPGESTAEATTENEEKTSDVLQSSSEELSHSRARVPAKRLTANGSGERLTADGERLDVAFRSFQEAYPEERRKGGHLVEQAYLAQAAKAGGPQALVMALNNHKASEQWQTPKLIPGMDTWLTEERWRQRLPAAKSGGKHFGSWRPAEAS